MVLEYLLAILSCDFILNKWIAVFHVLALPVIAFTIIPFIVVKTDENLAVALLGKEIVHGFNLEYSGAKPSPMIGVELHFKDVFRECQFLVPDSD